MTRTNQILLVVLLLQVGLGVLLIRKSGDFAAEPRQLFNIDASGVDFIRLVDNNDFAIEFAREGNDWRITSHHGYPAKNQSLQRLAREITSMTSEGEVTTAAAKYAQYGVSTPPSTGRIDFRADGTEYSVTLGQSLGVGLRAGRVGDNKAVESISGGPVLLATSPAAWTNKIYFQTRGPDFLQLIQGDRVALFKATDTLWVEVDEQGVALAEQKFAQVDILRILHELQAVELLSPLAPKAPSGKPLITAQVFDNGSSFLLELSLYPSAREGHVIAKTPTNDYPVLITIEQVSSLLSIELPPLQPQAVDTSN